LKEQAPLPNENDENIKNLIKEEKLYAKK